jgi:molybdopterin-guanine dinucleotide biosynthesis protein A
MVCVGTKYRGTEKHKVVVEGEVLLERIVKQFSKYSDDIVIVGNDESYRIDGTTLYTPLKTMPSHTTFPKIF